MIILNGTIDDVYLVTIRQHHFNDVRHFMFQEKGRFFREVQPYGQGFYEVVKEYSALNLPDTIQVGKEVRIYAPNLSNWHDGRSAGVSCFEGIVLSVSVMSLDRANYCCC